MALTIQFINKKSAQLFSLDMIFAVAIFLLILLSIAFAWDHNREKLVLTEQRNDIALLSRNIVNSLLETEGNPSNWTQLASTSFNKTNVYTLGLVKTFSINAYNSHKKSTSLSLTKTGLGYLELNKILTLYNYDESMYNESRDILSLSPNYDFQINFEAINGFTSYGFLGASRIAYTYANGNADEGSAAKYGIRDYLASTGIGFTNYSTNWQQLITDINSFDVVIFEDPHLSENDLTAAQQDALKNWVSAGGIYFQKEHGKVIEIFNVTTNDGGGTQGTVIKLDPYLTNLQLNDTIQFEEGYRISKQNPNIVSLVEGSPDHTLVGYFYYGSGKVYYLPDTQGTISLANGTQKYNNTRIALNLPKIIGNITFGFSPQNASNIVVIQRRAYLDDNRDVNITLRVWQPCEGVTC